MIKVNLADTYMRIWVQLVNVPVVAFIVTREKDSNLQIVDFHLSTPIGYV